MRIACVTVVREITLRVTAARQECFELVQR
jgi:hypothetical protein